MSRQRVLFGLACCIGFALVFAWHAPAQEPKPKTSKEMVHSLKEDEGLELVGPDADKLAKYEAAGLRVTLPAGYPKLRPAVGVASNVVVKGDFEITVNFQVIHEPGPNEVAEFGTRLTLIVGQEAANQSCIKYSRAVRAKTGSEFLAYSSRWNADEGTHEKRSKSVSTQAKSGRLRLVRADGELSFYAAEGAGDFELLRSYRFTADDLKSVRILANTDGPKASLDVRVSDLRILMGGQENQALPAPPNPAAQLEQVVDPAPPAIRGWLIALVLIGFVIALIFAFAIGFGVYFRKRGSRSAKVQGETVKP